MKKTNKIEVSICCFTYNQKDYISQAIESFLVQKTNFSYEILIHDDCSTDGTTEIIKEYEKKYPDLIKVAYESENQYSKGNDKKIFVDEFRRANGKYIAICEGDDYWCDDNKLQKQYDFIEKNPKCSVIVHGCYLLNDSTGILTPKKQPYKNSRYYSVKEVIIGDGGLFATNSMFFKKDLVVNFPKFYYDAPVVDFPLIIHLALNGKVYFMRELLSVYRINAKGSWTSKLNDANTNLELVNKRKKLDSKLETMMIELNKFTKFKYDDVIKKYLLIREYSLNLLANNFLELKSNKYRELYKVFDMKGKVKLFLIRRLKYFYKLITKG